MLPVSAAPRAETAAIGSSIYVTPFSGGPWVRITDGRPWDDKPRWSPDGRTIYFVSSRDGFFNLWGIHFDPVGGRPLGVPSPVTTFKSPSLMVPEDITAAGVSLTSDRLVITLTEASGGIWMLDNVDK